jgi:hypothetical protein
MFALVDFLIRVVEEMLIHLVMYHGRERCMFRVEETPDNQVDIDFPVKYKLLASFKPPKATATDPKGAGI